MTDAALAAAAALVTMPRDCCPTCGGPVVQARRGRTKTYCQDRCRYWAKHGVGVELRGATVPAWVVLAQRAGWTPAH